MSEAVTEEQKGQGRLDSKVKPREKKSWGALADLKVTLLTLLCAFVLYMFLMLFTAYRALSIDYAMAQNEIGMLRAFVGIESSTTLDKKAQEQLNAYRSYMLQRFSAPKLQSEKSTFPLLNDKIEEQSRQEAKHP